MASIWWAEVNKRLKELIPSIVKYRLENETLTPIPTFVRTPDSEYKIKDYPCATITNLSVEFDQFRYLQGNDVVVSRDIENGTSVVEPLAKPFTLTVQIDFWAKYYTDIDLITMYWSGYTKQFDILTLNDSNDTEVKTRMNLTKMANVDKVKDETDRVLHRAYVYEIWGYVDEMASKEVKIVLQRIVQNLSNPTYDVEYLYDELNNRLKTNDREDIHIIKEV